MTNNTSVYSNADGAISINNCSFTGSTVPVNFNHKANGSQTLIVEGCSFTNCGDDGNWKQFAAPVRFVNSGIGMQSATVDTCTFEGTVGSNGDILIGDGRTGEKSNDVSLTVTNTTATVKAQKPGYYNDTTTDTSKGAETTVTSGETLNTSVEEMLPTALTAYVTVNGGTEQYATLDEAIAAAGPENGVITYTVTGKVNANGESWIQVAKAGLTGLTEVKFVGADANAEICITNSTAVLADQSYDIDVSFKDLTLSHPNGAWVSDLGHATNYFTTVLRNTDAANNTVSYTNCTFPNGACNNQYGKTVYANCKFTNATSGKYNLWNYGGNTEIKNSTFTGTRGIKAYSEGTDGGDISISGTTFDDLNEKAAIVASKPVGIVLDNVAVTGDSSKGLFTRDISGNDELTISATGTGISGTFDITSDATGANAKDELNISAGTFNSEVSNDYCADGFEVKANGDGTYGVAKAPAAKIGDTAYETLDAAIAAANDGDTIIVNAGEYKLNGSLTYTGKAFTIKAADGAKVSFDMSAAVALHGAKITFENVTFDYKTNGNYIGMQHTDTLVYNSCTINGQAFLYATNETFNKCKFNQSSNDAYNVWTYGAKNVAFNSCTFNCAGKSVLVYNEGSNEQTDLTVTDTQFNASETVNGKAAIEIDTSLMNGGATVIVDDKSTATGFSNETTDKAGLWNVKKKSLENNKVLDVTVAGEKVYSLPVAVIGTAEYPTITAAITAAADGDTVKLLADTTEDVVINKDITLDLGGKTLTNTNAGKATISVTGGTVTVKNGNVVGGTSYYNIEVTKDSNANLTLEGVTATAGNTGSSMIDNYGTLTITSGTYTGGLNVVKSEPSATLTINGGTFTLNYAVAWSYTGVILTYGTAKITAGQFVQNATTPARAYPCVVVTAKETADSPDPITEITGGSFINNHSNSSAKIFHPMSKATSDNIEVSGGTFNKSIPDSYCKAGFIPTKNADGTYGVKEGKYVAQVGSKYYETLADAIRLAAKGKTITLLANVKESVEISKNLTLDLNGFTLTNEGAKHTITVNEGVSLTIKDSVGTGTVDNVTHGCGALVNNGTVILSGGTFERSAEKGKFEPYGNGGNSWYTIANYGTMTINNGTTVKNAGGYSSNIRNGGQDSTAKLTINGGTFDGGVNTVKNDANGVLEIKGGELKNTAQYVIMNWNQATISGGTFETAETAGAVLFSSAYGTDGTACGELTITGGTFTAAGSKLIDDAYDANNHGTVKISGGSFNRAVDPKHCDTGFIPTQNEDGTYGVKEGTYVAETGGVYYESLQAAIDAAPRKGTVKLLADTRENVTINTPYLTLDLNGHTLNGGTEKGKPALTVTARVTVKDGSEAQTGTIMREDTAENSGVSSHYVIDIQGSGWLTFESGNVKNGSGVVGVKGASLVRVGDDSVAKYPGLNIKGGTFTQDNFIVIKVDRGDLFLNGGTLNSANSYAIEDWHRATIKGGTVNGAVAAWTYSGGLNSDLTISGGTINGDVTSVNYGNAEGRTAKVSITGGRVTGKLDTRSYDPATNELTSIDDAAKATIEVTGGTFNNDPTKYVVENSKVTNNADGTFGVEKAYLAKIGDKSYYTMDEAFHAVTEGQTIVLLRDYTTASSQNSGSKSFTFDLNGHTWTYTSTDVNYAAFEINYPDVTLTVKNGNVVTNSMLGLIPSAMGGTITYDNAGLVFDTVTATANGHSGIETNGNNTNDSVTLKNSTLNVPNGFGIYFPSSGTLTIENSKINAKTMGVQVCAGSLKISGADTAITVTGDAVPKTENDGAIQDGAAISIVNRTGYKALEKIEVTGGTFTAKTGNAAIKAYNWANNTETEFTEPTKVEVSGGTFSAEVPADLCAVGYEPTKMDTGMYTVQKVSGNAYYVDNNGKPVYGDFAALVASTNAATKGKTITLLKNVKIEDNLVLFGNRTVDLNGNVLEITEIFIGLYGKVIDSSDGNGLLKIAADNVTLQSDNGLLPIYDSAKGGYRLFSFTMKQQVTKPSDTTVKFKFGPIFENKEAYKLLLTGNNHNIKVTVTLKWISGDGRTGEQTFTFPQNLINGIGAAEGGSGFVINLTGFDSDITGSVSNVTAQWAISSGTGASVSGTPSVIYE